MYDLDPANMIYQANAGVMLEHCLHRWPRIKHWIDVLCLLGIYL